MVETAMLKVFASDALWRIVNDTLQIWGGAGYFNDQPFERMMRDARINLIGEGANDVLRCFVAMVGLRGLGKELESILKKPWTITRMWRRTPPIPVPQRSNANLAIHAQLEGESKKLARQIAQFSRKCQRILIRYKEDIFDEQCLQARIGDTATELFLSSCVYARLCGLVINTELADSQRQRDLQTGIFYMRAAHRRNADRLKSLIDNDDADQKSLADRWLATS